MVLFPALPCDGGLRTLDDNISSGEIDIEDFKKKHVSKIMRNANPSTNNEIEKIKHVNAIDPDGQFHLLTKYKCKPLNNDDVVARVRAKDDGYSTAQQVRKDFTATNILLMIPKGGESLEKWCENDRNASEIQQVLLEMYRILRGLYELQQHSKSGMFMVHADVLPVNILYDKEKNRLNLIDFGLSVYSDAIDPKIKTDQQNFYDSKVEGIGPEWSVLKNYENLATQNGQNDVDKISQEFVSKSQKESWGNRLCYWLNILNAENIETIQRLGSFGDGEEPKWCPESQKYQQVSKYWDDFHSMIINIQEEKDGYSYDVLHHKAIQTVDMYAAGYTILVLLGSLRLSSPEMSKNQRLKSLLQNLTQLCLQVVTGDVFRRVSWLDFLTQYEKIIKDNRIFRNDPLESCRVLPPHNYAETEREWRMDDMLRILTARVAEDWDLQKQIENQVNTQTDWGNPPWILKEFEYEQPRHEEYDTIHSSDAEENRIAQRCIKYIEKRLDNLYVDFGISNIVEYYDTQIENNGSYAKDLDNYEKYPWIIVDTRVKMVAVFWPRPQAVAWVWDDNSNDTDGPRACKHTCDQVLKFINELESIKKNIDENSANGNNDVSDQDKDEDQPSEHEYTQQEVEFISFERTELFGIISQDLHPYEIMTLMTELTCMELENIHQEKNGLSPQANEIASLIRDHWATRLSTRLNELVKNTQEVKLVFFAGIYSSLLKKEGDDETLKLRNNMFNDLMSLDIQNKETSLYPVTTPERESDKTQCTEFLPDPSWVMRGLAEFTNAYLAAFSDKVIDHLPHLLCIYMPSEMREGFDETLFKIGFIPNYNYKQKIYEERIKLITIELKKGKSVRVVFPEGHYNFVKKPVYYYVKWFLYEFQLVIGEDSSTLNITTPRDHVFEVTRKFAWNVIEDIKKTLEVIIYGDNVWTAPSITINVIRVARPHVDNSEELEKMPLFVQSLSSSWLTEQRAPPPNVRVWLKDCQEFLISCGFSYVEKYDNICMCQSSKCTIINKALKQGNYILG